MTRALAAALLAALVVLAGCGAGGLDDMAPTGTNTDGPSDDGPSADGSSAGGGSSNAGTIAFYLSDRPNAIDDFEHLTVTVTRVGFHRAGGGDAPSSPTATPSPTATATGAATATATATGTATDIATDVATGPDTATATSAATATATGTATATATATGTATDAADGPPGVGSSWVVREVDGREVDLTELRGENARRIADVSVPAGTYDNVFVYVDGIEATLTTGERVRVKLPSERLHVAKGFSLDPDGSTAFVFDIAVHEAGQSGKYVLRPVVGQSGTDVPIRDVDAADGANRGATNGGPRGDADATADPLEASFVGRVTAGESATLRVTLESRPAANATVEANGEPVGRTDDRGRITFAVPDAETLRVVVRANATSVVLERELVASGGGNGQGNGNAGARNGAS